MLLFFFSKLSTVCHATLRTSKVNKIEKEEEEEGYSEYKTYKKEKALSLQSPFNNIFTHHNVV